MPAILADLPRGLRTRYAPAPTGLLHRGHLANAVVVWGLARTSGGDVILRVEDHDRQRCRAVFETAVLDDLDALAFVPDEPSTEELRAGTSPFRQSDNAAAYEAAVEQLTDAGIVYACDCSRATFGHWRREHGAPWAGPGCPGACAQRNLPRALIGLAWRVSLGGEAETWQDLALGAQSGEPAGGGDLPIRDRNGNWTYALCVVVDDLRHDIDLVIRGADLTDTTAAQIRLGRLLGRPAPPAFLHHPLILDSSGRKLSKAGGSTSVRALLAEGESPGSLVDRAAAAIGALSLTAAARSVRAPRVGGE